MTKASRITKGELYDSVFYQKKMIVLGKADAVNSGLMTSVKGFRSVLRPFGKGKFYELSYSSDGFLVDSYLNPVFGTGSTLNLWL